MISTRSSRAVPVKSISPAVSTVVITHSVRPKPVMPGSPRKGGHDSDSDQSDDGSGGGKDIGKKSRRELPSGAVTILKTWLLSPEHFTHPYPTPQDQVMLMRKTGIDKKQLKNWFTNARRRIWKPMLKKQLESGTLAATGGGGVAVAGVVPGLMVPPGGPAGDGMQTHYQQVVQQKEGQAQQVRANYDAEKCMCDTRILNGKLPLLPQQYDQYGNPVVSVHSNNQGAPYGQQQYNYQYGQSSQDSSGAPAPIPSSHSIGSLPPMGGYQGASSTNLSKNDSHAVLMELFARDQDLVRQAAESAKMKAAAAAKGGDRHAPSNLSTTSLSSSRLAGVPSMNSWPHFSSISSLNNLGTMTGVKSIASLSGADLASQGNVNRMGNLAQVKSVESMGKNDSYAFLEVFFGDRGSSTNLSGRQSDNGTRSVKREEDNDVGLSLDADESPSTTTTKPPIDSDAPRRVAGAPQPAPLPTTPNKEVPAESGTLKRAYDDALAARGLISVSRSCEKLTDLALPAKMQRTLSQEYLRQHHQQQQIQIHQAQTQAPQYAQATYPPVATPSLESTPPSSLQYPGQSPGQNPGQQSHASPGMSDPSSALSDPSSASVEVSATAICALCQKTNVDTQLRPCGHMFHERCLKPSLQTPMGQPRCPIDRMPMESALLAVPTDEVRFTDGFAFSDFAHASKHFVCPFPKQNLQVPTQQPQRQWNDPKSAFSGPQGPVNTEAQ